MENGNLDFSKKLRLLLKESTSIRHETVEKLNFLSKSQINEQDYKHFLLVFYKIIKPIEKIIGQKFNNNFAGKFKTLFRTPLLLQDLESLGVRTVDINSSLFIPKIENIFECIGVLYVIEGSALGGSLLYKKLTTAFGKNYQQHLSFLNSLGQDNWQQWQNFLAYLENFDSTTPENKLIIIDAANSTFTCFEKEFKYFNAYAIKNS